MSTDLPIAARPLNKGLRATKLEEILATSVKQTLRVCSYEKLATCFPTLANKDPETLRHAGEQVVNFLSSACHDEFTKILQERDAFGRLNELDVMIARAKDKKEAAVAPAEHAAELAPDALLRAHILPIKRAELAALLTKISVLQQSNSEALALVQQQRLDLDQHVRDLRRSLEALASSETAWQTIGVQ